jgi:hypothetical protein
MALFDLLLTHVSPTTPANPKLPDETDRPAAIARAIEDYIAASVAFASAQAAALVLAVAVASASWPSPWPSAWASAPRQLILRVPAFT